MEMNNMHVIHVIIYNSIISVHWDIMGTICKLHGGDEFLFTFMGLQRWFNGIYIYIMGYKGIRIQAPTMIKKRFWLTFGNQT